MLKFSLLHPPLITALASAGHGARILIADGNYPHSTGTNPAAALVFLNLRPGLLGVDEILETIDEAVPIESAAVMVPTDGAEVPAHAGYRACLGASVPFEELGRFEFYEASRSRDVAVVVASADQRIFANLLLTIGVRID
jgi:L-fucose mutarotase